MYMFLSEMDLIRSDGRLGVTLYMIIYEVYSMI
jgi:hypothetical protein